MEIDWSLDEHLRIRSLTPGDAEELFVLVDANREHLRPWMTWEPDTNGPGDVRAFIERSRASTHDVEANGLFLDGVIVGTTGLTVDAMNEQGELGYWLAAHHQGKGLITRACARFITWGFDELALGRISLLAAVGNARSRAVAERLGMTQEGILRSAVKVASGRLDLVTYSILPSEWPEG
jgi:ribosomal-protein-serine acetyltransferase